MVNHTLGKPNAPKPYQEAVESTSRCTNVPKRIRTSGLSLRRGPLCPAEL